jgi:hypothetical protein
MRFGGLHRHIEQYELPLLDQYCEDIDSFIAAAKSLLKKDIKQLRRFHPSIFQEIAAIGEALSNRVAKTKSIVAKTERQKVRLASLRKELVETSARPSLLGIAKLGGGAWLLVEDEDWLQYKVESIRYTMFLDKDYLKEEFPTLSPDASPEEVWEKSKADYDEKYGRTFAVKLWSNWLRKGGRDVLGLGGALARP